jgi:hypothetical protein
MLKIASYFFGKYYLVYEIEKHERMRCSTHAACEKRTGCNISVGNPEGKRPLGGQRAPLKRIVSKQGVIV